MNYYNATMSCEGDLNCPNHDGPRLHLKDYNEYIDIKLVVNVGGVGNENVFKTQYTEKLNDVLQDPHKYTHYNWIQADKIDEPHVLGGYAF